MSFGLGHGRERQTVALRSYGYRRARWIVNQAFGAGNNRK